MYAFTVSAFVFAAATMTWTQPIIHTQIQTDWVEPKKFCGDELTKLANLIGDICRRHLMEKRRLDEIPEEFPKFPTNFESGQELSETEELLLSKECCDKPCSPKHLKAYCTKDGQRTESEHVLFVYKNKYILHPTYENQKTHVKKEEQKMENKNLTESGELQLVSTESAPAITTEKVQPVTVAEKFLFVDEGQAIVTAIMNRGKKTAKASA